ncbi:hypothetical protein BDR06DRAFT_966752 [Suillus hirtellus]|nr:hypothetical protein BDR06DRAFT_966752 [Suillus hirtellus]
MMRPNTCPKNANQHPGEILLQNKRKRHTAHQIQEDNEQVKHEWQEKEAAAQHTTEKIASIEDKKAFKDSKILMHAPKPQPWVSKPNIKYDDGIVEGAAEMEDVEMRNIAVDDNDGDEDFDPSEEENAEVQLRNKHLQKTAYYADCTKAYGDQKGKILDICAAKDNYVRMGKTKDWAEKLATSNPHPTNNVQGNLEEHTIAFLDEDDSLKYQAAFKATKKPGVRHTSSMDVLEFGKSEDTPPPPAPVSAKGTKCLTTSTKNPTLHHDGSGAVMLGPTLGGNECLFILVLGDIGSYPLTPFLMPLTTKPSSVVLNPMVFRSGVQFSVPSVHLACCTNHWYQNDDLPKGCQDGNTWCQVFIPTVAHWTSGEAEPWGPEDDNLRDTMQEMWNYIYQGKIQHEISRSGVIIKVAKQHLMKWHGGFSITACSILTAFFAQDTNFSDTAAHEDFSRAMLKHNWFIFRDNSGLIPKDWTGMWRSPFILQTFTSHLNFTFGCVEVPDLNTENISAWAAFALAVTAVYHTLQLIIDGNITFKVVQESCGKRKGMKTNGGDI